MRTERPKQKPGFGLRWVAAGAIMLCIGAGLYFLTLRLVAQSRLHQAKNYSRQGSYGLASARLKQAAALQPRDALIQRALGEVSLKLAGYSRRADSALGYAQKAQTYFYKASRLNPLDADTYYGLARCVVRIRHLNENVKRPARHTADPRDYLKKAISLRPNSITYRYALAKYYHHNGQKTQLKNAVEKLARIYPPVYSYLRKEDFWSPEIAAATRKGLTRAVAAHTLPREAHMALSALAGGDKDFKTAAYHYRTALAYRTFSNHPENDLHLGRLYFMNKSFFAAEKHFAKAIKKSHRRDKHLETLYHLYRGAGRHQAFLDFIDTISALHPVTPAMRILTARSLLDQKRFFAAERVLNRLNQDRRMAEAYFWLAKSAQAQKNWDALELAAQKAAFLESENSRYQLFFSQVLKKVKKPAAAEEAANQALEHAPKPSPRLLNHRAQIRWGRKDYQGAAHDWRLALRLKPDQAGFNYTLAEAYLMLAQKERALIHYRRAAVLSPDNERYQRRLKQIERQFLMEKSDPQRKPG